MCSMRSGQSELVTRGLHPDNERETVQASSEHIVYPKPFIRLPSALCKPSLRTYFDWDDSGNGDYAKRQKLLDIFAGSGGCSMGYYLSGFAPYGIDNDPKPLRHYPFPYICMDALEVMGRLLRGEGLTFSNGETLYRDDFASYHASPPCQKFSIAVYCRKDHPQRRDAHPDLVDDTRQRLLAIDRPFVIENVKGSPLQNPIELHGTMFGLKTNKARLFELHGFEILLLPARWQSTKGMVKKGKFAGIMQHSCYPGELVRKEHLAAAYEINWGLTRYELRQAIPPAYTEYIGLHLKRYLDIIKV